MSLKSSFAFQTLAVIAIGSFSVWASATPVSNPTDNCVRVLSTIGNSYSPNRNNLVISASVEDENFKHWTVSQQIDDQVFDMKIVGYEKFGLDTSGNFIGTKAGQRKILGHVSNDREVLSGDFAFPNYARKLTLAADTNLRVELVQHINEPKVTYWRLVFE